MVGLPGFRDTPWTSTPGSPRLWMTCAVMSRVLTELPAERISTSLFARASEAADCKTEKSSGKMPARHGWCPSRRINAASVYELTSRICAGPGAACGSTSSSPPETMPTLKREATRTRVMPSAIRPPISCARSSWPLSRIGSSWRMSSPNCTTFSPGATARKASIVVGPTSCVCSTMTTASAPSGSMPPVAMRAH